MTNLKSISIIVMLLLSMVLQAQDSPIDLNEKERKEVVTSVAKLLKENYVFPKEGKEISDLLLNNLKKGVYQDILKPEQFSKKLTEDIQSINQDKHLRIKFDPERVAREKQVHSKQDSIDFEREMNMRDKQGNFGFRKVEILKGNVGYLDLRGFQSIAYGREAAEASMQFLSNTDAIIFDLRQNGGGNPDMIQLLSTYLFDKPTHLNNFYWRSGDKHLESWTFEEVKGSRMTDTDVYVLTSSSTFSAAEEFSYNLQQLKRATIIGETTKGGAHPGGVFIATDRFTVWIAVGRAINPISKTNWEGVGVVPHMKVEADKALEFAHMEALKAFKAKTTDARKQQRYEEMMAVLSAENKSETAFNMNLAMYQGKFEMDAENNITVSQKGNNLVAAKNGGAQKIDLVKTGEHQFMATEAPVKIHFKVENEKVVGLTLFMGNNEMEAKKVE